MTLKQEKFQKLMKQYEKDAQIISLPCPGLMEFVERGDLDGDDLKKYLTELFWSVQEEKIDSIVLGCTHYPFAPSFNSFSIFAIAAMKEGRKDYTGFFKELVEKD